MKKLATVFKALGDEVRLEIVTMLMGKELCVCDIMDAIDKTQPTISHHLKALKYAGVVTDTRDGKWIYYSLNPEAFEAVCMFLDNVKPALSEKVRVKNCE